MEKVRVVHRKWPERPHWEADALLLGEDEHGTWVGYPPGTLMTRPGVSFHTDWSQVTLVRDGAAHFASFYGPGASVAVYVDITTPPLWRDGTVTAVDLDLDVVRGWTGRVWVDDEDEFAEHRELFGYPEEVVALAARSCDEVRSAVESRRPPYDGPTAAHWLGRLEAVMMDR